MLGQMRAADVFSPSMASTSLDQLFVFGFCIRHSALSLRVLLAVPMYGASVISVLSHDSF